MLVALVAPADGLRFLVQKSIVMAQKTRTLQSQPDGASSSYCIAYATNISIHRHTS
jgi:hypothetical protein